MAETALRKAPKSKTVVEAEAVGLGNAIVDALVRLDDDAVLEELGLTRGQMHPVDHHRWHQVYDRVHGAGVDVHSGGSCANTMQTLALCGASVRFCGQVGKDRFGELYGAALDQHCGGNSLVEAAEGVTGKCLALISRKDGERTMLTDLGIAGKLGHVGHFADRIRAARVLHLEGYLFLGGPIREAAFESIAVAEAAGVPISLDCADPFVARTIRDDILMLIKDHVNVGFFNREEAEALTGRGAYAAIDQLSLDLDAAVVKLGGEGSLVRADGHTVHVPVYPTTVADTTGAGDAYAGGFLYGWLQGWRPEQCGHLGSRVAALTVGQVGAVCRDHAAILAARAAVAAM